MVTIRLARLGKRNDPFYRIVAIDSKKKGTGQPAEILGYWHPKKDDKKIDAKLVEKWVALGAIPSPAVKKLLEK